MIHAGRGFSFFFVKSRKCIKWNHTKPAELIIHPNPQRFLIITSRDDNRQLATTWNSGEKFSSRILPTSEFLNSNITELRDAGTKRSNHEKCYASGMNICRLFWHILPISQIQFMREQNRVFVPITWIF